MTRTIISRLLLVMASCIATSAIAESTTINIDGNVIASPCEVSSDSITKAVALDGGNGFQAKELQSAGATSDWVTFDINLTNCPVTTSKAIITFSGTPDSDHPEDMYANSGTAENVAVQLEGTGGQQFGNGKSYTYTLTVGEVNYPVYHLRSRVYTEHGGVTPGTIQAVVTANFTYQ